MHTTTRSTARAFLAAVAAAVVLLPAWQCTIEIVDPVEQTVPAPPEGIAESGPGAAVEMVLVAQSTQPVSALTITPATPPTSTVSGGTWTDSLLDDGSTVCVYGYPTSSTYTSPTYTPAYGDSTVVLWSLVEPTYACVTDMAVRTPSPEFTTGAVPSVNQPSAGLLTAGEWHDHLHWDEFRTFLHEYPDHFDTWKLDVQNRVIIEVVDKDGLPLPGVAVEVKRRGEIIFAGMSLADGTVAFFPSDGDGANCCRFTVRAHCRGAEYDSHMDPVAADDQRWLLRIPVRREPQVPALDLAFVVDVTGSMGDELRYLQAELLDITGKVFSSRINGLRVGLVFYRDRGDAFVTKVFDFSGDVAGVTADLQTMWASGGGDFPESVNLAMKHAMGRMSWTADAAVRVCFLVADAPPHYYADEQYTYREALDDAVAKGVKVIPVAGSGIDRATEYLFRIMAVKTMGRYIFLTDDSGIGGTHLDPDIGEHTVESLNDIIVRAVNEELELWAN